jgi:hypothetical protein
MRSTILAVLAALALALPGTAIAQHKHSHSPGETGKHGGQLSESGAYHVELVAKGDVVEVYVADLDDKPIAVSGFKGLAILSAGGKSQRITLEAGDGGKMTGKAAVSLPTKPKGVVQFTPPGGKTVSVKF